MKKHLKLRKNTVPNAKAWEDSLSEAITSDRLFPNKKSKK